ncbi:MAG: hypothetical protein CMK07_09305 [Ponticaulis sp.]|nr:hypothetical protein [Ponticaulis sp.]
MIILGLVALFLLWAGLIVWTYFGVKAEARKVYAAALQRGEFPATEPYEPFETAYLKTSILRVSIYRWLASVTAVIALPIVVWLLNTLWVRLYYLTSADGVFAEGTLIHSFYLAVGCMLGLVLVAGVYARAYHKGRKTNFEVEWADEKQRLATN